MMIRIGSRESKLAIVQAEIVGQYLRTQGHATELITMKTTGDIILDKPLDKIGGKGLFVKELDQALFDRRIDIAVHSYKDLPMQLTEGLPLAAVSAREDARDALILPLGATEPQSDKPIGCSSLRRALQLSKLYPRHSVIPLRGNVLTRLEKLDKGEYAAIVLAMAGLKRLGLAERASRVFESEEMLPAAAQGILAVQARADFNSSILAGFHNAEAWDAALAERTFVTALGGGCSSPITAYAQISGSTLHLRGLLPLSNGGYIIENIQGQRSQGVQLAQNLAESIMELSHAK